MASKVKCTCGWSWDKSDSSVKDMYICHECGRDNSNNMKNGGWLDNYGKEDNYNDYQTHAPEGFQGDGYSNVGRNSSPAWGGQFQTGGKLKFLQPTSDKLPKGYRIPYSDPSSERAMSIGGEDGEPAYLIPSFKYGKPLNDPMGEFRKTGEHLGGPFKTWQEADKWENETRHPAVEKGENIMFPQKEFQMGGVMPGAVGHMYARHGSPSKGPRRNQTDVTDASAQNGKEMQYYQQGLDWKPKTISQDGSKTSKFDFKKFNKDQKANTPLQQSINKEAQSEDSRRWFDTKEYKNQVKANQLAKDKAVVQDRKDRLNKSAASQKKSFTKDNWRQQLADETQATGDKFRMFPDEPNNFVDEWLNPGVMIGNMASDLGSAPLRAQQEDSYMPYVTSVGVPLLTGGLEGIGAKSNSEFVSNLVNPLNIVPGYKSAEKAIGQQLGNVGSGIKAQTIKNFPKSGSLLPVIDEHMGGLKQGIIDVAKGRPLFETFPITQAQKQASNIVQNKAMQEGIDFVDNWYYKNGQLRPEVENRIDNIYLTEPNYGIGAKNKNPLTLTENKLVSTRSSDLPFENISADSKEYLEANRGRVAGFNSGTTNESITLRNMGMYRLPGEEIKKTVVHESGHSAQDIGDYIPWGTMTTEYSPELKYFTSNPDTNIGKRFKNALRTPVKPSGNNYAHRTWQSSPNELHSELMSARSQLYDKFLKQGVDPEEAMGLLQNPGDETLDALYKIGGLDQFFKQNRWGKSRVPTETKRDLMRLLPAAVPAAVGAGALQQQKNGGIIKDDRGQWDHPGEITRIQGGNITMKRDPRTGKALTEPILGIADTGEEQMMYPGEDYNFEGAEYVTEYPKGKKPRMAKNGLRQEQKGLQNLDNLTNFTNYNTKQPGSWLNKYN
jgi:hypothetical protein